MFLTQEKKEEKKCFYYFFIKKDIKNIQNNINLIIKKLVINAKKQQFLTDLKELKGLIFESEKQEKDTIFGLLKKYDNT